MKLKVNDQVVVIAGKDKGKKGKITKVFREAEKVVVEKVNMRVKHIKKSTNGPGERITFEAPIHASNVMVLDPKTNEKTRIGYKKLEDGKKIRIAKKSGESLDK
ncbi:50S ribosomal protein L24 [Candidatus Peregrinibacteria bacterium HGW-Peregrinibacteria-1]|jgi:large subunit ribosomal protein L24|nr:ribosomal protein L24 [uncultured bacterium]PKL36312.1 MAG: 50S ribosomal protein L24 [Candidatus Peregrinibacteria bacterium HGW-Peregrinibacteria-1]